MSAREEGSGRRDRLIRRASGLLLIGLPVTVVVWVGLLLFGATQHAQGSPLQSFLWACHVTGTAAAHGIAQHSLHLLFGGGAVVVFTMYALHDIHRNGWPSLSWRLRHPADV